MVQRVMVGGLCNIIHDCSYKREREGEREGLG